MSFQEPVNVMGVVAFPNPDKEKRVIRFIDSSYNDLFTVADGGSVILTHFDGRRNTAACAYIDDCHAKIGNEVYHICQFAEIAERNGVIYEPEAPIATNDYGFYEIYQIESARDVDYCFRSYDEAKKLLKPADYQRVYAGVLAKKVTLDELYAKHNRDRRPFGRQMRSLSMSDIIVTQRGGVKKAYYVDDIGFKEVPKFLSPPRKSKDKKKTEPER